MTLEKKPSRSLHRRTFVKTTLAGTGFMLVKSQSVHGAPANSALQMGLIGCGGRGASDAGDFIRSTNTQVVALADPFEDRLGRMKEELDKRMTQKDLAEIDPSRLYQGMDAYKKLLDSNVDVVLVTSPPYYHPLHLAACVEAGKHVYCEKPVAIDVDGALKVMEVGKKVGDKCSVMIGFQLRKSPQFQGVVERVHQGAIGDVVMGQVYYHAGRLDRRDRPGASEDENRLRNWVFDKVLSGDIIVEQNIHVIDIANWHLQSHPVKAFGTCGRKARVDVGDCNDHFVVTYWYPNDVRIDFSSSQFLKGWGDCRVRLFGTNGTSDTGYSGFPQITGDNPWQADSDSPLDTTMVNKMQEMEESIRSGKFVNQCQQGAESTLSSILGRMAAYQERVVTWDEMMASKEKLDAGLKL